MLITKHLFHAQSYLSHEPTFLTFGNLCHEAPREYNQVLWNSLN
jgi:hypothetical protein